jgi:hypothetical protein
MRYIAVILAANEITPLKLQYLKNERGSSGCKHKRIMINEHDAMTK